MSVSSDYNFVLIPVFFGMIAVLYNLIEPGTLFRKGVLNLILLILSLPIFLSGSRRGIFTLSVILGTLIIVQILGHITDKLSIKKNWELTPDGFCYLLLF